MTEVPAEVFGLRERGVLREGYRADVVVLEPATVGRGEIYRAEDLPGNSWRLTADSVGIERVFVNGVVTVADGKPTGATPGTLMHSGRDTRTPSLN